MTGKGMFMRVVPFVAALAIGTFIASFFVTIGPPRFRGRGFRHREVKQLRMEVQQLRDENQDLRDQIETMRLRSHNWLEHDPEFIAPVPPPVIPLKPAAPRAIR